MGNGTWQQYVVVSEEVLVAVPDAVSDEAAAQSLINPVPVIAMFQGLAVPKGGAGRGGAGGCCRRQQGPCVGCCWEVKFSSALCTYPLCLAGWPVCPWARLSPHSKGGWLTRLADLLLGSAVPCG